MLSPLYWPYMLHFTTEIRELSALDFGLLKGLFYITVTVFEVPSGVFADRFGRRSALLWAIATSAVGTAVIALAHDFGTFAAGEILLGISTSLSSGAYSALLYDSFQQSGRSERYARAEGQSRSAAMAFTAVGLIATDRWLVVDGDPVGAYWASAVIQALSLLAVLVVVEPERTRSTSSAEISRGAVREALVVPTLRSLIVYGVGIFVLIRAVNMTFYNPILSNAGFEIDRFGTVFAGVWLVGALGAWMIPSVLERAGLRAVLIATPLALLAMYLGLALEPTGVVLIALLCIQSVAIGSHRPMISIVMNQNSDNSQHRATLLSLHSMVVRLAWGGLVVFAGWSIDALPLPVALLATAAMGSTSFALAALLLVWPRTELARG